MSILTSVHYDCKKLVVERIKSLNLDKIGDHVYSQMVQSDKAVNFPAILVTTEGESEQLLGGTNAMDDIGYPVRVAILDHNDSDDTTAKGAYPQPEAYYLGVRQALMRAFRHQRLPGAPTVYVCRVEPHPIIDPKLPLYAYFVSGFTLRFVSREPRGFP